MEYREPCIGIRPRYAKYCMAGTGMTTRHHAGTIAVKLVSVRRLEDKIR